MRKLFSTLVLGFVLLFSASAVAQPYGLMPYSFKLVDENGDILNTTNLSTAYFDILIENAGLGTTATVYSDPVKTAFTNPTADTSTGYITFWGGASSYDILVQWDQATDGAYDGSTRKAGITPVDHTIVFCAQSYLMTAAVSMSSTLDVTGDVGIETDGWLFDVSDNDFVSKDSYVTEWGTGKDVSVTFNGADWLFDAITASEGLKIGDTTTGFDLTYYFETAGTINTSYTGDSLEFDDAMILAFGSDADYTLATAGSTGNLILDSVDDDTFQIGNGTDATDIEIQNTTTASADISWDDATETFSFGTDGLGVIVILRGDTAGAEITWDEAADDLLVDGSNIVMHDTDKIGFGDASAEGTLYSDATTMVLHGSLVTHDSVLPNGKIVENHNSNHTLTTLTDSGQIITVDTAAVVIELPAVAATDIFRIMNIGADTTEIHVDVNAADKICGGCGTGAAFDDGDKLTNTGATAKNGDYVEFRYYSADGWQVTDMVGIWADGG